MTQDILDLIRAIRDIWLPLLIGWHVFMSRNPHNWN